MSEKPNILLPKWPFLLGDIILILLACFIVIASPKPMSGIGIFACALSVILGMLVYVTPYIIEHLTQQQRIKLKQAKAEETLLKAVELASDLLKRTESIHAELMKGVLSVRQVPAKLEETTEQLVEIIDSDKLSASVTELSDLLNRLEAQPAQPKSEPSNGLTQEQMAELLESHPSLSAPDLTLITDTLETKLEELRNELSEKFAELEKKNENSSVLATSQVAEPVTKSPLSEKNEVLNESADKSEASEEGNEITDLSSEEEEEEEEEEEVEEVEVENDEAFDESSAFEDEESGEDDIEPEAIESEILIDEGKETSILNSEETAVIQNEDGATRLIVGAFIGISNKLYIRGEGPGLDWDKGVPMELVGIGKWEWKTYGANTAVQCKVLINDEQWTDSENITIEPNTTMETTASF